MSLNAAKHLLTTAIPSINADTLTPTTELLGTVPEFDSLTMLTLIGLIEEQYGVDAEDLDLSAEHFSDVGTFAKWLELHVPNA